MGEAMNVWTEDAEDAAIDAIYHAVDALLAHGETHAVDMVLDAVRVDGLPIVVVLSFATITLWAAKVLKSRADYMRRAREYITRIDPARAQELLRGLDADGDEPGEPATCPA